MDIMYDVFLTSMNNIKKITGFSLVAGMFLVAALAAPTLRTAYAQNTSTAINETATKLNETATKLMQTAAQLNQTAAESANKTSTANQTSANKPDLTKSDIQDIQKTLEDVKKSIAEGKAVEALKQINQIDDKLLDAMSKNPPPMLDKSSGNSNKNN